MPLTAQFALPSAIALRPVRNPPPARRSQIAPTETLLTAGGDSRIALDASGTANRYGCGTVPDASVAAFGSSTASIISAGALAAAEQMRSRLAEALGVVSPEWAYARELERIRQELIDLCGLGDLHGVDVAIAASGTDLHLLATQLAASGAANGLLAVMVEPAETGSCVAAALAGTHFDVRSALGLTVPEGVPMAGHARTEVAPVPCRAADGSVRSTADVGADIGERVAAAASKGQRVLLTLIDVSKTGVIAPSLATVLALQADYPGVVDVLVDACQFRIAPATLRAYLERGFMVAVTGSKFVTGPAFSGALFVPEQAAQKLRRRALPAALRAYAARAELPSGWVAARSLPDATNPGLLIRWEAALHELRLFRALPEARVTSFFTEFATAIANRLGADPAFEPLPVPAVDRTALGVAASWDRVPTIFPFLLRAAGAYLTPGATDQVYRALRGIESRAQLGQPVLCGTRNGRPVSALRMCMSARLAVEGTTSRAGSTHVIRRAIAVLDRTAELVRSAS